MKILRNMLLVLLFGAPLANTALAAGPSAGSYPDRPIRLVVPWAAGGFTDTLGRLLADKMAKSTGQPVIVENRPGASGSIGSEHVSRAAPDGYTLLLNTSDAFVYAINTTVNPTPSYNPLKDFTQISLIATQPVYLAVGSKVPAQNVGEFVKMAKANPGSVSFGSSGEGSAVHLAMELFSAAAGIKMIHVPYKGINPALLDVLAGRVQAIFISYQGAGSYFETGKLRPLAITALERSAITPKVPTLAESGYPDFKLMLWYEIVAPKGTPHAVVGKINHALKAALEAPDLRQKLTAANTTPVGGTPEQAQAFLVDELAKWKSAVKAAKNTP